MVQNFQIFSNFPEGWAEVPALTVSDIAEPPNDNVEPLDVRSAGIQAPSAVTSLAIKPFRVHHAAWESLIATLRTLHSISLKSPGPRRALSKGGGNGQKCPFLRRVGGSIRPRLGTQETREP
jgi:hypothetical protein